MIYFNEFSLNGGHTNLFGLTKAQLKGYIAQNTK